MREVRELAQLHTEDAVGTLVTIMQDRKQPAAARVNAASVLLDRGYGRAPQAIAITPLPYAGEVTVTDPIHAAQIYRDVMGGTIAIEAVRFEATSEPGVPSDAVAPTPSGRPAELATPLIERLNGAPDG